ncbi:hypothetical protein TcWFU_006392 [Taenia crassiceps]|uniref:Supervillin n=1 Tax=Taenia crassiceps TaxID=6207 RepID=A0ABR4QIC3_9CEST
MAKHDRVASVRNRLARAMTVPNQDFVPPTFGIAFTKKGPLVKQANITSESSPSKKAISPTPTQSGPQAYGSAQSVGPETAFAAPRYSADVLSSPAPQRAQTVMKQARPGSVFIPRRSPIDSALTDSKTSSTTAAAATTAPTMKTGSKSTGCQRVRFASPATQTAEVSPTPVGVQLLSNQASFFHPTSSASQNGFSRQARSATPTKTVTDSQPIPAVVPVVQQPLAYSAPPSQQPTQLQQPSQTAFAVIAQDPSALQALLSGDLGGRTFIIQPLQQSYILPQFQPAAVPFPSFAVSQTPLQPQFYPQHVANPMPQQEGPVTVMHQPASVLLPAAPSQHQHQPPLPQSQFPPWQAPILTTPRVPVETTPAIAPEEPPPKESLAVKMDMPVPTMAPKEAIPPPISEPLTVTTESRSLAQTAPCQRSPPRSVQSIFKQNSPQIYQSHEAHKIPLREPQKLSTPTFLQPSQQQVRFSPPRETTPNPPQSNPLCEYVQKLKLAPPKVNRRALASGGMRSKSIPESENPRIVSMAAGDSSVVSVMDRARRWQQERRQEELGQSKSGFVDQDLIACGDELVPVEERVRAFNTGQVVEENEAAKKKLNDEFEEERNRRIREQSFSADTKPKPQLRLNNKPPTQRMVATSSLTPQVVHGDTLTKLSVKEKSNLFSRRSSGGRPVKFDRASIQRRKTQPITLDDIARVNQCVLEGRGAIPPESPMECFKEEDLEIGSCLSSPTTSVISDFSELVYAQSPTKPRKSSTALALTQLSLVDCYARISIHILPCVIKDNTHVCTASTSSRLLGQNILLMDLRAEEEGEICISVAQRLKTIEAANREAVKAGELTSLPSNSAVRRRLQYRLADRTWRHSQQSCQAIRGDSNSTPQLVKSLSCVHVDDTEEQEESEQMSISQRIAQIQENSEQWKRRSQARCENEVTPLKSVNQIRNDLAVSQQQWRQRVVPQESDTGKRILYSEEVVLRKNLFTRSSRCHTFHEFTDNGPSGMVEKLPSIEPARMPLKCVMRRTFEVESKLFTPIGLQKENESDITVVKKTVQVPKMNESFVDQFFGLKTHPSVDSVVIQNPTSLYNVQLPETTLGYVAFIQIDVLVVPFQVVNASLRSSHLSNRTRFSRRVRSYLR